MSSSRLIPLRRMVHLNNIEPHDERPPEAIIKRQKRMERVNDGDAWTCAHEAAGFKDANPFA
jgi:hypothetical protein